MSYTGVVEDGKVVLPPDANIPSGTRVRIEPILDETENRRTFAERFHDFIGIVEGPADLAQNHDHYIHGTPKK